MEDTTKAREALEREMKRRGPSNLESLAEKTLALQTVDKFKLAAALLLLGPGFASLACTIGRRACDEIQLALLFPRPERGRR